MKVAENMIYAGGNNWVLERIDVIDGTRVYFRLSDTMFTKSQLSYEDVQTNLYECNESYWEVGADNWVTSNELDDLTASGWFQIFNEMLDSWQAHDKRLRCHKVTVPVNENYTAEIERVKMLKNYIDLVDKQTDLGTEESTSIWYNIDWTIGFAGMTITVKNCAAVYNAIQELIEDYEA